MCDEHRVEKARWIRRNFDGEWIRRLATRRQRASPDRRGDSPRFSRGDPRREFAAAHARYITHTLRARERGFTRCRQPHAHSRAIVCARNGCWDSNNEFACVPREKRREYWMRKRDAPRKRLLCDMDRALEFRRTSLPRQRVRIVRQHDLSRSLQRRSQRFIKRIGRDQ